MSQVPDSVSVTTLDNGIRVATERMPSVRSVAVGFWVGVGSVEEQAPLEGATHFLEHLLFKGTTRRSSLQIAQVLDAVGGDMNAFTSKEYTAYYARCLDRDLGLAIDVLGDMLTSSTILAEEVETERQVVLEEIHMHHDTPDDLVHSVWAEAWFGDHVLGREILGSEASMTAMTRDQVAGWWQDRYTTDVITVAVSGNVEHDAVVAMVRKAMGGQAVGSHGPAIADPPAQAPHQQIVVASKPTEQVHVVMGGAGLPRGHDLRWAMAVLHQAFGGGMASRLFQEVREKRGLAYSVYCFPSTYTQTGTFATYAGTTPSKAAELIGVIEEEMDKMRTGGLTADELSQAKGYLTGSTILALEDTSSRMSRIGRALTTGTPLLSLDEVMAAIDGVTAEDVAAVAELVLSGPRAIGAVGPIEASDLR